MRPLGPQQKGKDRPVRVRDQHLDMDHRKQIPFLWAHGYPPASLPAQAHPSKLRCPGFFGVHTEAGHAGGRQD